MIPYCLCLLLNNEKKIIYKENKEENIIKTFIEFLEKEKIEEIFYVHNLTFDGILIIENLPKKEINFKAILFKSSIYELEI
jgi:hypothetical protein